MNIILSLIILQTGESISQNWLGKTTATTMTATTTKSQQTRKNLKGKFVLQSISAMLTPDQIQFYLDLKFWTPLCKCPLHKIGENWIQTTPTSSWSSVVTEPKNCLEWHLQPVMKLQMFWTHSCRRKVLKNYFYGKENSSSCFVHMIIRMNLIAQIICLLSYISKK